VYQLGVPTLVVQEQRIRITEPTKTPHSVVALYEIGGKILSVTRKGKLNDWGLPGGKIEPGESPEEAIRRECWEEVGIDIKEMSFCYERIDPASDQVAWCYWIHNYLGVPRAVEANTKISYKEPEALLVPECTFREYNRGLFKALGWIA
jgi:8-oxo-dGTP pyrophosphatase MutT (NUDIX family)